jgi:phosphoglycerol transferase MdoB-like AlkP superfamily enzyme
MVKKWKAWEGKQNFLLYVVLPVALVFAIELATRMCDEFWGGFTFLGGHPYRFLSNVLIVELTLAVSLFTRRRVFVCGIISVFWMILGICDVVLLNSRNFAFNPGDLANVKEGLSVAGQYLNVVTIGLIIAVIIGAVAFIGFIFVKLPKWEGRMHYLRSGIIFALIAVAAVGVNVHIRSSATYTNDLRKDYYKYGFISSFTVNLLDGGVSKPAEYSAESINKITGKEDSTETEQSESDVELQVASATPNIIVVQLESFFDITTVSDLTFNEDPIPWFREYQSQFAGGLLTMPSVGAGTANSEFVVLTGMNLADFGAGEYPYKTILQESTCESFAYNLKEYGYGTHAIHNNTAGFYSRKTAFPNLGFDDFTTIEFMNVPSELRTAKNWAKDSILTEQIMLALDETEGQDFVYTISVQGHGVYPDTGEYPTDFTITSDSRTKSQLNAMAYYSQQISEMDQFVHDLITTIEERGEDTIIVFYGDHLPSFSLTDDMLDGDNTIYQTPYLIWNNFGMEYESKDLEAYELQSYILAGLNMNSGVINRYHQEYADKVETDQDSKEYLEGLKNLEYDILYGDKIVYNGINPYVKTDMQLGIKTIKVNRVVKDTTPGEEGYVYVYGENFTQYSKIFINEEYYGDTEFIDENTLRIYYPELEVLDSFVVNQAYGADSILSSAKECLYYGE